MQVGTHSRKESRRIKISEALVQDEIYYGSQASVDAHDEVTSAAAVARFRARQDVVRRRGRYGLINENRTPYQAMVEDLMFIRSVLDGAGLDYLLVRGNNHRPVIAVDWKNRKELRDALVAACHDEPFYSMSVDAKKKSSVLIADGELSPNRQSRIFRLYRPRVEPEGGFEFGASAGVQLELWSFEGDQLILPIENSLTRRTLLAQDAVRGTVERYGHTWPTIENMFADHASDISFDIDLVFSWVDGSSPEYIAARRARMAGVVVGEGDDHEARFRQIDELKYALRSVYMFAPWIRRIFIATDSPAPSWLADHPSVTIVRSEEFFADPSVLPTHNSQAVECQLHHIEGLSEHFLYSNDDMFFGRAVGPDMFFTPGGITKFIEAETRIGLGDNDTERSGFENAARVNRKLLWDRFGRITTRHLEHTAAPLRRSVVATDGAGVPCGVREDGCEHVPRGRQHLGDQFVLPLLRAAHRPCRHPDGGQGALCGHHRPGRTQLPAQASRQAEHGLLLPQRRQLPRGPGRGTGRTRDGLPGEVLPHQGSLGEVGVSCWQSAGGGRASWPGLRASP